MNDYIKIQRNGIDSEEIESVTPENVEVSTLLDGYVWWTCGACGNLQHTDKQAQYCSDCGRKVKWEGE